MKIEDGGPAFPPGEYSDGMSLRDYFAAAALQGLIAAHAGEGVDLPASRACAIWAYEHADAMLRIRKPASVEDNAGKS